MFFAFENIKKEMKKIKNKVVTVVSIILIVAITVIIVPYVKIFMADRTWISDFGYQSEEIHDLSFDSLGCPEIETEINSAKYCLTFDTGCERGLALTEHLDGKVDYTVLSQAEELNRDGTHKGWSKDIMLDEFSVFGQKYTDVQTSMIPWSMTSDKPYNGLIGVAYFQSKVITLDYTGHRIGIMDRPIDYETLDKEKYIVLPLYKNHGQENLLFFEASVKDEPVMVYLDTGKNYSFIQDVTSKISIGDKPKGFDTDVNILIGDMELTLKDIVRVNNMAQGETLPYPVEVELNSDQIKKLNLLITIDLINQKIIFARQ